MMLVHHTRCTPLVLALVAGALIAEGLSAQTVSGRITNRRDDIPATIRTVEAALQLQPWQQVGFGARYRNVAAEQSPFQGVPQLDETFQAAEAGMSALLFGQAVGLEVWGGASFDAAGESTPEYYARLEHARAFDAVTARLGIETSRRRDASVTTAIHEDIVAAEHAATLALTYRGVSGNARLARQEYSDANTRTLAYGYTLMRVLDAPAVSLGYAYSWADSRVDHWQATGSRFHPATQTFSYEYFYYPYFTPVKEKGHMALAHVSIQPSERVAFAARANVPIASTGWRASTPATGTTPQPPPTGAYFQETRVLPLEVVAEAAFAPGAFRLSIGAEYFSKSYYSYTALRANLQYIF